MGGSQSVSLNEPYELKLTPSLFKYDEESEADATVDITDEHTEKISAHVNCKDFKQDIETITDVSIRPSREGASTVQLKFKQASAKYSASEGAVLVTGKWTSTVKQRKPSVKKSRSKPASSESGAKKDKETSGSHLAMMESDDEAPKTEFEKDLEDISVTDIIEKIQEHLHHEAYLEHKLKGQLFICFKEDIDLKKIVSDD
jgi:hypothetical protein